MFVNLQVIADLGLAGQLNQSHGGVIVAEKGELW
jgi:hypothetical protein